MIAVWRVGETRPRPCRISSRANSITRWQRHAVLCSKPSASSRKTSCERIARSGGRRVLHTKPFKFRKSRLPWDNRAKAGRDNADWRRTDTAPKPHPIGADRSRPARGETARGGGADGVVEGDILGRQLKLERLLRARGGFPWCGAARCGSRRKQGDCGHEVTVHVRGGNSTPVCCVAPSERCLRAEPIAVGHDFWHNWCFRCHANVGSPLACRGVA